LLDEREGEGNSHAQVKELTRQAAWGSLEWQYNNDPLLLHKIRRQVAEQIAALQG